jgi:hypothetical protein
LTRTDSGLPKEMKSPDNIKYLELVKDSNQEVRGVINYLPVEKDSIKGKFIGIFKDGYLNIIYSGTGEGIE